MLTCITTHNTGVTLNEKQFHGKLFTPSTTTLHPFSIANTTEPPIRRLLNRYRSSYSAYFSTFNDFLSFGWQAIVVTDKKSGKGHVVVRGGSTGTPSGTVTNNGYAGGGAVGQFARMIKTR
jgi:hypothetical protein